MLRAEILAKMLPLWGAWPAGDSYSPSHFWVCNQDSYPGDNPSQGLKTYYAQSALQGVLRESLI